MSEKTGIVLKEDKFWILQVAADKTKQAKAGKTFFADPKPAYEEIKKLVANGANTELITLVAVDCKEDEWKIKQVPWDAIFRGVFEKPA